MSVLNFLLLLGFIAALDAAKFKCDYTFYKDAGGYLKFQEMPLTFDDAKKRCTSEGGILVSPINDGIKSAMMGIMNASKVECAVMTGINAKSNKRGIFSSIEGVYLADIPHTWAPGEPDNYKNEEKCIVMLADGTIADVKCGEPFPYFCFMKTVKAKNLSPCGLKNKDYTYDAKTGSCYKFHRTSRVYNDAAKACEAEGGYLLIINGETEVQAVKNLYSQNPTAAVGDSALAGFGFNKELGLWMTLQDETIAEAGYDKWAPGEPNNATSNQNCGAVFRSGMLDDIWCDRKYVFICEKDPEILLCN